MKVRGFQKGALHGHRPRGHQIRGCQTLRMSDISPNWLRDFEMGLAATKTLAYLVNYALKKM